MIDAARLSRMAYMEENQVMALFAAAHGHAEVGADTDTEVLQVLKRVTSPPTFLNDIRSDAQGYGLQYSSDSTGPITMLVFRGTSALADAFADASVRMVPLKGAASDVLVHRGFQHQFSALKAQSVRYLSTIYELQPLEQHKQGFVCGAPVLVAGHSLGSAVAAICAMVLSLDYGPGVSYIGFGTPRVGNKPWADLYKETVQSAVRVKNGRDPVDSCIPPVVYRHIGAKVHVGVRDPYPDICLLTDLEDHDMAKYISKLQKDDSAEHPFDVLPYLFGFLSNAPVATLNLLKSLTSSAAL